MDIISFNEASTANSRIEIINANPDSESGLITVPKVIASGESVTVPEGRIAVLPNVQVDGELNIEGEIFVPSGSTIDFTNGITVDGNRLVMSVPTSYHIYNGSVEATNTVLTNGFSTTLHTGNGTTQSVTTGVDMATQWGNTTEETFGGLVWVKSRSVTGNNYLFDTIRGATHRICSDVTNADAVGLAMLTSFNNNGFTFGNDIAGNTNAATYVSWNFQTTHRKTGVTNHGKAYTEHYNPYTGFTIIKYEGSELAGHKIPHSLGRKLGFVVTKNLSNVNDWVADNYITNQYMFLNLTNAGGTQGSDRINTNEVIGINGSFATMNASTNQYIMYGWANSYYDENNTLIGNYEVGVYQGHGAAGNKVTTRGKPAWVMIKRLDTTDGWFINDNVRGDKLLNFNTSNAEVNPYDMIDIVENGFILKEAPNGQNASGGQYLYMVVYDNDSGSGKSKYPKATDSSQLQINALIPFANGVDGNGAKNTILSKNETITGLTLTQGKNYVYGKNDGTYGVKPHRPRYLSSDLVRTYAGESPDYYDVVSNKWYSCDVGSELVTNGTGLALTGWTGTSYNGTTNVSDASVLTLSNQTFVLLNATSKTYAGMIQAINGLTIGKKYKLVFDIASTSLGVNIYVKDTTFIGTTVAEAYIYGQGNKQNYEFIATATTMYVGLTNFSATAGHSSYIDNISVFQTDITPTSEITDSRNYLDAIVYADHNGQVEYVEQLPKTQYVDEIKANVYRGKNACTAWVNFDGTTTPPTIRDSYNVASVVRTSVGKYDVYFKTPMDNDSYFVSSSSQLYLTRNETRFTNKVNVSCFDSSYTFANATNVSVDIMGGKN